GLSGQVAASAASAEFGLLGGGQFLLADPGCWHAQFLLFGFLSPFGLGYVGLAQGPFQLGWVDTDLVQDGLGTGDQVLGPGGGLSAQGPQPVNGALHALFSVIAFDVLGQTGLSLARLQRVGDGLLVDLDAPVLSGPVQGEPVHGQALVVDVTDQFDDRAPLRGPVLRVDDHRIVAVELVGFGQHAAEQAGLALVAFGLPVG